MPVRYAGMINNKRVLICYTPRLLMRIDYLSTILKTNKNIVVLTVLASAIVIFGGIAVYLANTTMKVLI